MFVLLKIIVSVLPWSRNIQNVIAKMESGQGGSKDALLVNCHFDSVPQSPGASDDAVSCAIMLEILDVLMQSDRSFRHNLIFLFNGAEENLLPVSFTPTLNPILLTCFIISINLPFHCVITVVEHDFLCMYSIDFVGLDHSSAAYFLLLESSGRLPQCWDFGYWVLLSFRVKMNLLVSLVVISNPHSEHNLEKQRILPILKLQGSHGFITQHMWASEIRAFINLEACGAGGRELVFQSGPDNPWMIEAYGMAAPHPFASVVGQGC